MKKTFYVMSLGLMLMINGSLSHADDHHNKANMIMHHMHLLVNHATHMAIEGSNQMMIAKMKMAEGIDELALEHGKNMVKKAKELITRVETGKEMEKLHAQGIHSHNSKMMKYTHALIDKSNELIKLLEEMPSGE